MPRGDGTGPAGMGPMTGRAAGYCAGYDVPGYANPVGGGHGCGRGFGRGRGWFGGGRGWRHRFYATGRPGWARPGWAPPWERMAPPASPMAQSTEEQELEALREQAVYFSQALEEINQRIDELSEEGEA